MQIRSAVFTCLFVVACAASAADLTPQEKFAQATSLMRTRDFSAALPLLEDLNKTYPTASVFWNLGIAASEVGKHQEALAAWQSYRRAEPGRWDGRAKLVQAYQALGDLASRDRERAELVALWKSGADPELAKQQMFCREQFRHDGRKVMVFEYFNPSGDMMVIYSFVVLDDKGEQAFKLSLGSYEFTNKVALELGERPADKRVYHLDLYRATAHETHGFFLGQPGYDLVRARVAEVLAGKSKASSSSRPSGGGKAS
jgi:tetratricopeptide (TPR) repeat protein